MSDAAVDIKGLTVDFGTHVALRDINFTLPKGGFLTIVGPNGCGKSTLLKTILGLIEPSAGEIRVCGRPPADVPATWLGYVPQFKTLDRRFPAIALELVATGIRQRWPVWLGSSDRQAAEAALHQVGASHLARRVVGELSGGELQRIYLARALVRSPQLVILDEPATGIDVIGEKDFYALLERYHQKSNATILMVTHDWTAAEHHASHVLLLKGIQVAFGASKETITEHNMDQAFGHVGHRHPPHEHGDHDHA